MMNVEKDYFVICEVEEVTIAKLYVRVSNLE